MTMNHHVNANADGPDDGIDWDALAAEVRAQVGFPIPADLEDETDDDDADAALWPVVLDAKGKPTGEIARPNPQAMRAALDRAAAVDVADVERLANAVSGAEARQIIRYAAERRALDRELAAETAELRARLAATSARRQAEHDAGMAEGRRRRAARAESAMERRDRALDPTWRIVRLVVAERTVPWIGALPALMAAVLGAVNVGASLDVLSPGTHAVNWLLEPLMTLPVLAILVAQLLGAVATGGANPFRRLEWALIGAAAVANVGVHYVAEVFGRGVDPVVAIAPALVWGIVPAGLAISAHLVPRLLRAVRDALAAASAEPDRGQADPFRVGQGPAQAAPGPVQSSMPRTSAHGSAQGSAEGPPPQVAAGIELSPFERLLEAVRTGQLDPERGAPVNPASAASIARTLRIREASAAELRDRYRSVVRGDAQ